MNDTQLLGKLNIEQKIRLLNGCGNWNTVGIKDLGLTSVRMSDGPHGLRKEIWNGNHCTTMPSTCFPPAVSLASSWDTALIGACAGAIGDECAAAGVDILLGPGVNIKRSPLCGRNFEYFSEDPYLAGHMVAGYINGLQAKGVGASLKHFCCNNQETARKTVSAQVDERALRETYLQAFEIAVKLAKPFTVMSSYNRVNGEYVSESERLLGGILRGEWGFDGLVVSDWESLSSRPAALRAGVDLEMPDSAGNGCDAVRDALKAGTITVEDIDRAVLNIIRLSRRCASAAKVKTPIDFNKQHRLARDIMAQCAVLLKNNGALPMRREESFCLIGELAQTPLYQGNGSSRINSNQVVSITQALENEKISFTYEPGYTLKKNGNAPARMKAAVEKAKEYGGAVVVVGLTERYESEGGDRACMRLPYGQLRLMDELIRAGCKLTVILMCGSPVELPFNDNVDAILNMYCGGEAVGEAVVDLLFGDANPCGKLAETFPLELEDNIVTPLFAVGHRYTEYRESIFIGYKYYDTANKAVAYPFGHGLSYTQFTYSGLQIEHLSGACYRVRCQIKNTGTVAGQEIVQLYIGRAASAVARPAKELKGFCKVALEPGEEKTAEFTPDERSFAFYHAGRKEWVVEAGAYTVLAAASSRDIRLTGTVFVDGEELPAEETPAVYRNLPGAEEISKQDFAAIYGGPLPENEPQQRGRYDYNSTFTDFKTMWIGKLADTLIRLYCAVAFRYPDGAYRKKQLYSELDVPIIREGFDKGTATKEASDAKLHIFNESLPGGLIRLLAAERKKKSRTVDCMEE
jgi:beta-glucosidase